MSTNRGARWDIFCKIVDNYGDIGVCWRLSQQLAHEYQRQVRLFIDDFSTAKKIIPELSITQTEQTIHGVAIHPWPTHSITLADLVLETFSCGLPHAYLQQMQHGSCIWINLEYLSAENWVSDFHGKPSPQPTLALTKHYFFPGFSENTGGLIREKNLMEKRNTFTHSSTAQAAFWQKIGVENTQAHIDAAFKISLFCYPQANVKSMLFALEQTGQAIDLFVPVNASNPASSKQNAPEPNHILSTLENYLEKSLTVGKTYLRGKLNIHLIPFLSQTEYDQLLWLCDLNFVRGEDSWIRAIWAEKPFIWQPYIQTENTHIKKLDDFLTLFYDSLDPAAQQAVFAAHHTWLENSTGHDAWLAYLTQLPTIHHFTAQKSQLLTHQTDLATGLVAFSKKISSELI